MLTYDVLVQDSESVLASIDILSDIRSSRNRSAARVQAPVASLFDAGLFVAPPSTPEMKPKREWPEFIAALEKRYTDRFAALLDNPCEETWEEAYSVCVKGSVTNGMAIGNVTLWQAVLKLDPTFTRSKPSGGKWGRIPSIDTIRQALGVREIAPTVVRDVTAKGKNFEPANRVIEAAALSVVAATAVSTRAPMRDVVFEPYVCQRLHVDGAQDHPTPLVESAAMASVLPPAPTYAPTLPRELIESGKLSIAQLEAVVYMGQAHREYLEPQLVRNPLTGIEAMVAFRKGWYLADGTGVGKGRSICGGVLDSFARGARKAIWVSKTPKLVKDAIRDWTDLGGSADEIIPLAKIGAADPILATRGILFCTYGLLKSAAKDVPDPAGGPAPKKGKTRLQQIVDWAGSDFDGFIIFDEAHQLRNAIPQKKTQGSTEPSLTALAGCDLQAALPDGKVLYASATGATEVANLAYCDRLGLWGRGTPFPNKISFVQQIEAGGIAAMELIGRDLKARGLYLARGLSFDGVEYDRLTHILSTDQREMYDRLCDAWQVVMQNIDEALRLTAMSANGNVDGKAKGAAYSAFYSSQQRFFNQILTAMQMPAVLRDIELQLAAGNCAVLQLVNTQEAMMERQLAKLGEEDDLSDIDMTPRDMLIQMVEHCFPVAQQESYAEPDGKMRMRPVIDSQGNLVLNQQAVAMREKLLIDIGTITCPDGPLEMLINHFGPDQVGEVTGRGRRVVRKIVDGIEKTVIEKRSPAKCSADAADFQDGKKMILVFSDAGGTGMSYHASLSVRNQSRRIHYLVQAGWVADAAVQGFGRTHRSAQRTTPMYKLVSTDLHGQRRFISSIARRLDQLGALTKGQRQAVGGLFSSADNLESEYARAALLQLYRDIYNGTVDGISMEDFTRQTGLHLVDDEGQLKVDLPPITQWLNRLLSMRIEQQNLIFLEFAGRMEAKIKTAMLNDTFDRGVETILADGCLKVSESVVNVDPSGAETKHVHLKLRHKCNPWTFEDVMGAGEATHWQKVEFFAINTVSQTVWAFCNAGDRTLDNGSVVANYYQIGPVSRHPVSRREIGVNTYGSLWKTVEHSRAREMWDARVKLLPEFNEEDLHLITGAILPIWDRLKGSPRVKRVATDDGERLLGRVIPEKEVRDTLSRLGIKSEMPISEVVMRLMDGSHRFVLANGWMLKRVRVAREFRIELIGDTEHPILASYFPGLKQDGLFYERTADFKVHLYVPNAHQEQVITALTKNRPIVRSVAVDGVGEASI